MKPVGRSDEKDVRRPASAGPKDTLTRMWSTIKRHVEVASHSDEAGQRQDNIKESTRKETERDEHSTALPFRTLYPGKKPSTDC